MQKHAILFLALAATAPTAFAFGDDGPRPASTAATAAATPAPEFVPMTRSERLRQYLTGLVDVESIEPQAARNGITIQAELATSHRRILADRVQLQQVVVNLILNAVEAMRDLTERPRRIVISSEIQSEGDVLVAVRDYGIGIDPKNQRRLFDPFFTTKAQGMGVGLNISRSIVEAHGGRLWATANSDCGATFQFTIPASPEDVV